MKLFRSFFKKNKSIYLKDNPKFKKFDIGEWSYGWPSVRFAESGAQLSIGKYCSIAKDTVIMLGGEHNLSRGTSFPFDMLFDQCREANSEPMHAMTKGDVVIGNDVWICSGAFIRSGVTIGDGAIVGAMSVVTKDIEPFSIVAGNPAKHVRYRFGQETRERLLRLAWWEWPLDNIIDSWEYLKDLNLDELEKRSNLIKKEND